MPEIRLSGDAERHLKGLTARERRILLDAMEEQLAHEPTVETRNRKKLRENPLAVWELRVQDFRVLYNTDEDKKTVLVAAIALKDGNRFIIDGKEYSL